MNAWGKGFTGIALACALSACGGGDGGSGSADSSSFTVSATVGGTKVQTFNGGSGQPAELTIKSGQDLRLDSSSDVNWKSGDATSNTEVSVKGASTQSWTAGVKSPPGGTFTITVTSAKDSSKSAKITVKVSPHEYTAAAPQVGRVITWKETSSYVDGSTAEKTRVNTTAAVDANTGITTVTTVLNNVTDDTFTQDADGNRLKRTFPNGASCTYNPKRNLLNFPLSVGKTWTSGWLYTCTAGYTETVSMTSTVEAYEPVTTDAGTFNTLRIHHIETITKSNDVQLQNGPAGNAAYAIDMRCWWDVAGQRTVKCDSANTYQGPAPANYVKAFSQSLMSVQ